jgi:hypothetical protein
MTKLKICWDYLNGKCSHCDNEHYLLDFHSSVVVIKAHYDSRDAIHISAIQGATLDGASIHSLSSKIHDDKCSCYDTMMTKLTRCGYEIKFVNMIVEKHLIVHLQKKHE